MNLLLICRFPFAFKQLSCLYVPIRLCLWLSEVQIPLSKTCILVSGTRHAVPAAIPCTPRDVKIEAQQEDAQQQQQQEDAQQEDPTGGRAAAFASTEWTATDNRCWRRAVSSVVFALRPNSSKLTRRVCF